AALGPKNLTVMRGVDSSVGSGAIVVVDRQPLPQQVSPATGPTDGGTTLTISGSNFRDGAKVYLGGLLATNISVLDSSTIVATTPQNAAGATNVQVINADGTNGLVSRGFNYLPPTPTVTGISPAGGPPT